MATKAYLDTHVVIWLNDGEINKLSRKAAKIINTYDRVLISEFVRLEIQYLYEIDRLNVQPDTIISYLNTEIGLQLCSENLHSIITESLFYNWTRDPFDRLITANASLDNSVLVTKDETILQNYKYAAF